MPNEVVSALLGGMAGFALGQKPKTNDAAIGDMAAQLEMVSTMLSSTSDEISFLRQMNAALSEELARMEALPDNVSAMELAAVRDALNSSYERIEFLTEYIRATLSTDLTGVPAYEVPIVNGLHVDVNRVYRGGQADPWLYSGPNGDIRPRGAHVVNGVARLRYQDSANAVQEVPIASASSRFDIVTQNVLAGKRFNLDVWNPDMPNAASAGFTSTTGGLVAAAGSQRYDRRVPDTGMWVVAGWTLIEFDESVDVVALLKKLRIVMNWKYQIAAATVGQQAPFVAGEAFTDTDIYVFANLMIPVRRNVLLTQRIVNSYGDYNSSGVPFSNAFTAIGDAMLKVRSANLVWFPYGISMAGYAHSNSPNHYHQYQLQTPQSGQTYVS